MASVEPGVDLANGPRAGARRRRRRGRGFDRERRSRSAPACAWARSRSSRVRASAASVCACSVGQSSATASTAEFERKALGEFVADTVRLARLTAPDHGRACPTRRCIRGPCRNSNSPIPTSGIVDADRALEIARTAERAALGADQQNQEFRGRGVRLWPLPRGLRQQPGLCRRVRGHQLQSRGRADRAKKTARCSQGTGTREPPLRRTRRCRLGRADLGPTRARDSSARARSKPRARRSCSIPTWPPACCDALAGAASGPSLYRGASFLVGRLGTEDRQRRRDDRRRRHDARWARLQAVRRRGSADHAQKPGRAGVLKTYLLDSYSARRLGLALDRQRRALGRRRALGQPDQSLPASPAPIRPRR